ncbi:MAG: endolytic transglycosylase MltG [Patescibacteria group bacterium]
MIRRTFKKNRRLILGTVILCILVLTFVSRAPANFPRGAIYTIESGSSIGRTAESLKKLGVIRSTFLYKVYITLTHGTKGVQAGRYLFAQPQSLLTIAYRTSFGLRDMEKFRITIPEGSTSRDIAAILAKQIPGFDGAEFHDIAQRKEGYLFPDTYFFEQGTSALEVLSAMTSVFDQKILALKPLLDVSTTSLKDLVIMASIIEEEANDPVDRRIISGILWKRISVGMPLQVDAPFYYVYGKGSSQLSRADLAKADPYNTYTHKGLPVGPISNPSLDALRAALEPTKTTYWFYLADRTGKTHYAVNHDGHVANKDTYLR